VSTASKSAANIGDEESFLSPEWSLNAPSTTANISHQDKSPGNQQNLCLCSSERFERHLCGLLNGAVATCFLQLRSDVLK